MVDKEKIRKLIPKGLVTGDSRYSKPLYEYQSKKRKLRKIERRNASFFNYHFRRIVKVFDDLEKALRETEF